MNKTITSIQSASSSTEKPDLFKISRRQFIVTMTGEMAALLSLSSFAGNALADIPGKSVSNNDKTFKLPELPNQNPGYRAWHTKDDGIILWTYQKDQFIGYKLNRKGRDVWRLCNGRRTESQILDAYILKNGSGMDEAKYFLSKMIEIGIVVSGAYIVVDSKFPKVQPGACYHSRVTEDDPKTDR